VRSSLSAPARCRLLLATLAACAALRAHATDWELSLDARLLTSNAEPSFMEGGLGTVRYGSGDAGLQLGRARLAVTQSLGDLFSAHLDASMYDDQDRSPVGITEAYLLFRPYPFDGLRLRVKAGAFYAPLSLENRESGWESPYTQSFSAIDSWLALEVRTLGVEGTLDWLGTRLGHTFDLGVTGGVFGWNQGAGNVIANDGFALTDRQTPVFGRVGQPADQPLEGAEPFLQFDHHAGIYGGLEARWLDRVVLRVLHYDNRANPNDVDYVADAYAWQTHFNSAGLRIEGAHGWTGIAQWLDGETRSAPDGYAGSWPFKAAYVLVAKRFGRSSLSARYDRFEVDTVGADGDGAQSGHAWTVAYVFNADAHWRITLEWLQVISSSYNRDDLGEPPLLTETQVQLAVRYALGSRTGY
jgi:hypothetical protein